MHEPVELLLAGEANPHDGRRPCTESAVGMEHGSTSCGHWEHGVHVCMAEGAPEGGVGEVVQSALGSALTG